VTTNDDPSTVEDVNTTTPPRSPENLERLARECEDLNYTRPYSTDSSTRARYAALYANDLDPFASQAFELTRRTKYINLANLNYPLTLFFHAAEAAKRQLPNDYGFANTATINSALFAVAFGAKIHHTFLAEDLLRMADQPYEETTYLHTLNNAFQEIQNLGALTPPLEQAWEYLRMRQLNDPDNFRNELAASFEIIASFTLLY